MGEVIPFRNCSEKDITFDDDFTEILKDVIEVRKKSLGIEQNGVFRMDTSFENMIKAKIGSFIIDNRLINAEIFRCSLYVSRLLNEMLSKTFESYYAIDYFITGIEEEDPGILQEGADLCCIICILFDQRHNWKMMRQGDYAKMGVQLYSLCYTMSSRMIAWCMSKHFEDITSIARKCIGDFEKY